ncbi:MAG TPA: phosphatidylglycerol lysyltransferase domain-containing protein [Mycobacteriales bacterium]|nr:phosphatidylglycerol lysyltransferase domain-containing protein [Mycobacteriales bacterium]
MTNPPTLAVVGCGPKAVAIAAKAFVLAELGWRVPRIVAIDPRGIAANWDGSNGYTDGGILLGTSPLEDVGFPYRSELEPKSDESMLRLSFQAFLIDQGRYAEWVDRAMPAPSHSDLAVYLRWVADRVNLLPVLAHVLSVRRSGSGWLIDCESDDGISSVRADGVVITGAGRPLSLPRIGEATDFESRLLDGQSFWRVAAWFAGLSGARICVIGGGETSAAIAIYLADVVDVTSRIEIVTRHATVFSRSEHWRSVMYFSTAEGWCDLTDSEKYELIHRADRGTFSVAANRALDEAWNVAYCVGTLERIEGKGDEICAVISHAGATRSQTYDFVIEATGFDRLSFLDWFPDWPLARSEAALSARIESDLTLSGLGAKLHVPGLAAMAQGPGFPHLSCLGLLADRVLRPYVGPPSVRAVIALGWTTYPTFRRVEEIGRDEYERVLLGCVPPDDPCGTVPSDYLWLSLMSWCSDAEAAEVDGGFCLRMPAYHGDGWLTALMGLDVSIDAVAALLADQTFGERLHFVPTWIVAALAEDPRIVAVLDRDNFDYVLDISEQIAAEGAAFREARRKRRSYLRSHPNTSVACRPLFDVAAEPLYGVFDSWASHRSADERDEIVDERLALGRLLGRADADRCLVAMLYDGTELAGFEIGEMLPDGTAVIHFMKISARVNGAGDVLTDALWRVLAERGVRLCNIEQDLGVPGLRHRKLMEKPAFLLEKYVVSTAHATDDHGLSRPGEHDLR